LTSCFRAGRRRRGRQPAPAARPRGVRARRERDAILATQGYRTLRFTDRQTENAPAVVAAALNAALTACAA